MKINTTLLFFDSPGVLLRRDAVDDDYMCTVPLLAAQVLRGGQAITVAADYVAETVGELALRGVDVREVVPVMAQAVAA